MGLDDEILKETVSGSLDFLVVYGDDPFPGPGALRRRPGLICNAA